MLRSTLKKSALALAVAAAAAAAIAPAAASAATITQSGGTLSVTANPGETNDMRVTLTDTYIEILENNSGGVQPQSGTTCVTFSPGQARCNLLGVSFIRVNAGDMHDKVVGDIYSGKYAFTMLGGTGNDLLDVTGPVDNRAFLYGEDGDDQLYGRQFGDTIYGGNGADELRGGSGDDDLNGRAGNDVIFGGAGQDAVGGGTGNDLIDVRGGGSDVVACGSGRDTALIDRTDGTRGCERVLVKR
jgi:Ca2+-binding RTX toxin-like protein